MSARQVILTWDPTVIARFWLVADYLPQIADAEAGLTTLDAITDQCEQLGARVSVTAVPVPADCTDGFMAAYWRRPHSYLDPHVRGAISALAALDHDTLKPAMDRLAADLTSGRWHDRHRELLDAQSLDTGYRLITAD